MVASDRKLLANISKQLESIVCDINYIGIDEGDDYDNMSGRMQEGASGATAIEIIDALEEACTCIEDAVNCIDKALEA